MQATSTGRAGPHRRCIFPKGCRSTRTGGAGLGLAIAKEIVELHGGAIRAESNGRFTSFVITLPLFEED